MWLFLDEWNESPPQHLLMKWHVGYKPPRTSTLDSMTKEEEKVARGEGFSTVRFDQLPAHAQADMLSHMTRDQQIEFLNKSKKGSRA